MQERAGSGLAPGTGKSRACCPGANRKPSAHLPSHLTGITFIVTASFGGHIRGEPRGLAGPVGRWPWALSPAGGDSPAARTASRGWPGVAAGTLQELRCHRCCHPPRLLSVRITLANKPQEKGSFLWRCILQESQDFYCPGRDTGAFARAEMQI